MLLLHGKKWHYHSEIYCSFNNVKTLLANKAISNPIFNTEFTLNPTIIILKRDGNSLLIIEFIPLFINSFF